MNFFNMPSLNSCKGTKLFGVRNVLPNLSDFRPIKKEVLNFFQSAKQQQNLTLMSSNRVNGGWAQAFEGQHKCHVIFRVYTQDHVEHLFRRQQQLWVCNSPCITTVLDPQNTSTEIVLFIKNVIRIYKRNRILFCQLVKCSVRPPKPFNSYLPRLCFHV